LSLTPFTRANKMKSAIVILTYLLAANCYAGEVVTADVSKKQLSQVAMDNIKKIKPVTSESANCQPACKPGRFSKPKSK
jgi:hypothetical protein